MGDFPLVTILVAVLGSGGLAAVITSVTSSIRMAKQGIAGREDKRASDIIKQRDEAWARATAAEMEARTEEDRADAERARRIRWQEEAARLRIKLIMAGGSPGDWPDDDTLPPPPRAPGT